MKLFILFMGIYQVTRLKILFLGDYENFEGFFLNV